MSYRFRFLGLAAALSIGHGYAQKIANGHLIFSVNDSLQTMVATDGAGAKPLTAGYSNSEFLETKFFTTGTFPRTDSSREAINGAAGKGTRWVIKGTDPHLQIEKILFVSVYDSFRDAACIKVAYVNHGPRDLRLVRWINNRYNVLPATDTTRFWSFQGSSHADRRDWIAKVGTGFSEKNYMGMNSSDYGGGIPVIDLWRPDAGLAVGSLETKPRLISLPVDYDKYAAGADVGVENEFADNETLRAGDSLLTYNTFVSVHQGDCFATLRNYGRFMQMNGIRAATPSAAAFEPMWCAWGYGTKFTVSEILHILPKVKALGFKWVGLDDGFQQYNGDWIPNKEHFPNGDAQMKALVDSIHAMGLKAMIWWAPLAVDTRSQFYKKHPGSVLVREDGSPQYISYWDDYYMAPTDPVVLKETESVVRRFIGQWGFDGLKLDGQHMNACAPDYGSDHNIRHPDEAFEKMPALFQLIYATARSIKPGAVIEFCPCGDCIDLYHMPNTNQFVASDPLSSWQVRLKGKVYKALMPGTAYFGDHVELTDSKQDFASQIGVGGVPGSKFTWPATGDRRIDHNLLTPQKEKEFAKFVRIYESTMLSKGNYRGDLYDLGYDKPETHAIEKDGKMYYAFYAPHFSGELILRGLDPDKKYEVRDYINDRPLGSVTAAKPSLKVSFTSSLLIEAK